MTAMVIDDGKRVAAGGARLQWHMILIADIELIARHTRGEGNRVCVSSPAAAGKLSTRATCYCGRRGDRLYSFRSERRIATLLQPERRRYRARNASQQRCRRGACLYPPSLELWRGKQLA